MTLALTGAITRAGERLPPGPFSIMTPPQARRHHVNEHL